MNYAQRLVQSFVLNFLLFRLSSSHILHGAPSLFRISPRSVHVFQLSNWATEIQEHNMRMSSSSFAVAVPGSMQVVVEPTVAFVGFAFGIGLLLIMSKMASGSFGISSSFEGLTHLYSP